mgnify:CR=1 FL=1
MTSIEVIVRVSHTRGKPWCRNAIRERVEHEIVGISEGGRNKEREKKRERARTGERKSEEEEERWISEREREREEGKVKRERERERNGGRVLFLGITRQRVRNGAATG